MIVDCHTHIWASPDQLGRAKTDAKLRPNQRQFRDDPEEEWPDASPEEHLAASEPVTRSIVFGFKSRYLDAEIPNDLVADYVRKTPEKLIGVAGIDPTDLPSALDEMQRMRADRGMKAIATSPAVQDFHPADSRAMQVFVEAARMKMPVFIHQGFQFCSAGKMEFARPVLLDEVARELPQLKIVIAHMGYPWVEECVVLLGKHANVFADISALLHRPWQAYNALLSSYQYGVIEKLLFGSDFPYSTPATAIESLYRLNQLVTGTNLPTIPRSLLAGIVERDALGLLGIETTMKRAADEADSLIDDNEA